MQLPIWEYLKELKMKKNSYKFFLVFLALVLCTLSTFGNKNESNYRIMFYNVENLFDMDDDPETIDEEFLPKGDRFWNEKKFYNKLNRIFQVIMAAGEGQLPAVIGFCEIENQKVLDLLLFKTALGKLGYKIIHKESPDSRGIDVALIYQKDLFHPVSYEAIPVIDPGDDQFKTRDILYVQGTLGADTLHFFVNHWPSKYGGVVETKSLRALAAITLRSKIDSILAINHSGKIVLMGDFNDSPFDESISQHLKAKNNFDTIETDEIYNLAYPQANANKGTNKYQGKWEMIDQIIVSGALLNDNNGITTTVDQFKIFGPEFLLEDDKNFLGEKPFRTYQGFKYNNGFSDHLPVLLDLNFMNN